MAQHAARQAPAQEAAFARHDRQAALERLHRGVEAGEADGVEIQVGALEQRAERRRGSATAGTATWRSKSAPARRNDSRQPLAQSFRQRLGPAAEEHQPRARHALRDRREQPVVLRRVLERIAGAKETTSSAASSSAGGLPDSSLPGPASSRGSAAPRASRCSSPAPRRARAPAPTGSSPWWAGRWFRDGPSSPPAPARGAAKPASRWSRPCRSPDRGEDRAARSWIDARPGFERHAGRP